MSPSLVQVQTFGGLEKVQDVRTGIGPTSGVVVSPDGFIMSSAFNFISEPSAVLVRLPDGEQLDAKIIATDYSRMLTLLKVEAEGLPVPTAAPVDESRVGQWTLAVGKAFSATAPNISAGVLSAKDRIWGKAIQTDAKTSPFNYGGLLIDIRGRALGVIAPLSMTSDGVVAGADWYDSGIGFAVPMDQVFASFERLKAGENLYRGTLGMTMEPAGNMLADAKVGGVREGSPAAVAGMKAGDVVTKADGRPVKLVADLQRALGTHYVGDEIELAFRRGDEERTVTATLEKAPEPPKPGHAMPGAELIPGGPDQPAPRTPE